MSALLQSVIGSLGGAPAPWHPSDLFQSSELGGAWDATDITQMYTDAGTTLTTANDDLIYQINDISGTGNHMRQATSGFRPLRKTNGVVHLLSDGTDDFLASVTSLSVTPPWTLMSSIRPFETTGTLPISLIGLRKGGTDYASLARRGDVQRSAAAFRGFEFGSAAVSTPTGTSNDLPANTDMVVEMHLTNNSLAFVKNTSTLLTLTIEFDGADTMTSTFIDMIGATQGYEPNMRSYRMIAIDRALASEELTAARAWLAAGYSGAT